VLAGVSVFYPAPGSGEFEKCRERNLLPDRFSLMRATAFPISDKTTRLEAATLLRLGRIVNFLKTLSSAEIGDVLESATPVRGDTRREIGKRLLGMFARDGVIRGMTPGGDIFEHHSSLRLCLKFRESILAGSASPGIPPFRLDLL